VTDISPQPAVGADVPDLQTMPDAERLFGTLAAPGQGEPAGMLRARLVIAPGVQRLPPRIRRTLLRFVNFVVPIGYRGKLFTTTDGVNVWFGEREWARFRLDRHTGGLAVSYDVHGNPKPVRAIVSHVRRLDSTRYLCLMTVRRPAGVRQLLYFTLEPHGGSR
jgi:hypothetical protein